MATTEDLAREKLREKSRVPTDTGWAWMCVLASFVVQLVNLGAAKSFGILFVEFSERFHASPDSAAWILALYGCLAMCLSPFSTALGVRYSDRVVVIVGGLLVSLGYLLSAFVTSLPYLYLTYGLITGVGCGLSYAPCIVILGQYFKKRRALANGIAVAGSGVGSFVIPPLYRLLIDHYGLSGALIIYSALTLHVCVSGALMTPPTFYKRDPGRKIDKELRICKTDEQEDKSELTNKTVEEKEKRELCHKAEEQEENCDSDLVANCDATVEIQYSGKECSVEDSLVERVEDIDGNSGTEMPSNCPLEIADKEKNNTGSSRDETDVKNSDLHPCVACLCYKPADVDGHRKPLFDWALLKNPLFHIHAWAVLLASIGQPNVFVMVPPYANDMGLSKIDAALLVSVIGASDLVGRIAFGFFMDLNILKKAYGFFGAMALSGLVCVIFPFARSFASIIPVGVLFGLFAGSYIALVPVILTEALGVDKLANAFGLTAMGQGLAMLVSFPFMGFLRSVSGSWRASFLACATALLLGASCGLIKPIKDKFTRRTDHVEVTPNQ